MRAVSPPLPPLPPLPLRPGPGRLEAIWLKRAHRGPMDARAGADCVAGRGLAGNVDRSRRRQVTLLEAEVWEQLVAAVAEWRGADPARLPPAARRANLLVRGIGLARTRGRVLWVGGVRLLVGGEVTPCERMDEAFPGLQPLMRPDWRGGVFAQVLDDGPIAVGDPVRWDHEGDATRRQPQLALPLAPGA